MTDTEERSHMTTAQLAQFGKASGLTTTTMLAGALGISRDRVRRMEDGSVPIPLSIALACSAIIAGLGPYNGAKPSAPVLPTDGRRKAVKRGKPAPGAILQMRGDELVRIGAIEG